MLTCDEIVGRNDGSKVRQKHNLLMGYQFLATYNIARSRVRCIDKHRLRTRSKGWGTDENLVAGCQTVDAW